MLDQPEIITSTAGPAAVIAIVVPRSGIREAMGPARQELLAAVMAQGIAHAGPWYSHHHRMDPAVFDFEIGVPLAQPVTASGRVQPAILPGQRMARTFYRGPYEGLASAWPEFDAWIAAQGYKTGPDLWEYYVSGPDSSPDPTRWTTEFRRALLD